MKLLLLSNSTNKGEDYLQYPQNEIIEFLGDAKKNILFIPYAAVTVGYDEYEILVADRFRQMGNFNVTSIHKYENKGKALEKADAIVVGGGNTFMLLHMLYKNKLIEKIKKLVKKGKPYIGWSAGANIVCPSIRTTNDMPVVWPQSAKALNLIPFQINPHYFESASPDFAGETRDMRLREFITVNSGIYVVGLREGSLLRVENGYIKLVGMKKARIYINDNETLEVSPGDDLKYLLNNSC